MLYVFLYYYSVGTMIQFTSNFFFPVWGLWNLGGGGFMFVAWWVKLCQAEMFVVWMEKYQPDEPKRPWAAPGQPDLLGNSF